MPAAAVRLTEIDPEEPIAGEVEAGNSVDDAPAEVPTDTPTRGSGDSASFDPSRLREAFGDNQEMIKEILQEFVEPATDNVREIMAAFDKHSPDRVAAAAHKLKSSSRAVGANQLSDICLALETAGKS